MRVKITSKSNPDKLSIIGMDKKTYVKLEILGDRILLNDKIVNVVVAMLEKELGETEKRLNALGYTMQDEPKEFKYHVNALKGRDDE